MHVLFVTSNRIGDAVLSSGLLGWLIERRPQARFWVAAGPAPAPLFRSAPRAERVIPLPKRRFGAHWLALWREAAPIRWDLVVDLRGSALALLLFARERRTLRPAPGLVHRVRHLAGLFGLADAPPSPQLWTTEAELERAAALIPPGGPVLALGPTANWGGKQWPADRFAELAQRLTRAGATLAGARVAVFGAANERAAARPLLDALHPAQRIDLVGAVDLPTAHACLARADLYVGNDSGLMHLAAAAGAPTLGLFGPSREELYAPWGERAAAVRAELSFEQIVGHPDYDHRRSDSWMGRLAVDKVEAAAEELLAKVRSRPA
jgi:ADP-heptose:LPS heptosyltransferase